MPNIRAEGLKKLGIWVREDLKEGVEELAASKGLTVTDWLTDILMCHVADFRKKQAHAKGPKKAPAHTKPSKAAVR